LIAGPFPSTSNPYVKGIRNGGVANHDQSRGSFLDAENISIKPSNSFEKTPKATLLSPTGERMKVRGSLPEGADNPHPTLSL
jgi:hypothetical protein